MPARLTDWPPDCCSELDAYKAQLFMFINSTYQVSTNITCLATSDGNVAYAQVPLCIMAPCESNHPPAVTLEPSALPVVPLPLLRSM